MKQTLEGFVGNGVSSGPDWIKNPLKKVSGHKMRVSDE